MLLEIDPLSWVMVRKKQLSWVIVLTFKIKSHLSFKIVRYSPWDYRKFEKKVIMGFSFRSKLKHSFKFSRSTKSSTQDFYYNHQNHFFI